MAIVIRWRNSPLKKTMATMFYCDQIDNNAHIRTHCPLIFNHPISSIAHQNHNLDLNVNLKGLCREGRLKDAIHILLTTNTNTHNSLHSSTCLQLLQTCIANNALSEGKLLHSLIDGTRLKFDPFTNKFLQNKLIHMYANCGSLVDARNVFDCMTERDVCSWNMIISAYQRHGFPRHALTLFHQMQQTAAAVQPNQFTFPSILQACAKLGDSQQGLTIHQTIIKAGFSPDVAVATALIDMYAKCGSVQKARQVFDKMPCRNAFSWTAMIAGYVQSGLVEHARALFDKMSYRNAVTWTAMISGYAHNGFDEKALETFEQMQLVGVKPSSATIASILPACAKMRALEQGVDIHQSIVESRFSSDVVVSNALIDMYAKCGDLHKARDLFEKLPHPSVVSWTTLIAGYAQNGLVEKARELFDKMPQRGGVSWNAMIAGYAQNGLVERALETFKQMQLAGVKPSSATFASILPACAKMGALEQGMDIHQKVIESSLSADVVVVSALIDMYAKCGSIHKARELFDKMNNANSVSWNSMIAGYAMHGYCSDALKLFELMEHSRINPNHVSFICVLFACSHAGLVDEGCKYFTSMSNSYGILPTMDHYICMVDLLGRAGYLVEALSFIIKMPLKPDEDVWMSLLGACRSQKNTGLGEFVTTFLFALDPNNAAPYVFLSNIYADAGRWGNVQKLRKLMEDRVIEKTPGCSWIEVDKLVHVFCVEDRSQPQT